MEPTIRGALAAAQARFADRESAPRDAEILLGHVLACTRAHLFANPERLLTPAQVQQFDRLAERRSRGEPIAYLTGRREFWTLSLAVGPDTLIPRPETELLVELALARLPSDAGCTVADLGTGSGAIALSIAKERPQCRVIATDNSTDALQVARANAESLGLQNVEFRCGEWLTPMAGERFDLIVSNPPYLRADDVHLLQGDLRFEPRGALVAGDDGLDAIRTIVATAPNYLAVGATLLLEHGYEQAAAVRELLLKHGYAAVFSARDLENRERVSGGSFAGLERAG